MDQLTRRIVGFGIHAGDVDGVALCRMFNTAISSDGGTPSEITSETIIRAVLNDFPWRSHCREPFHLPAAA